MALVNFVTFVILKVLDNLFPMQNYLNANNCSLKQNFENCLSWPYLYFKSKNLKDNYRPVSILSNISKIYERCLYDQIDVFFDSILSKYQCGFRRDYNAQHCLITLIEKWKKSVDNGGALGALFTDLSKVFDCYLMSF